MLEAEQQVRGQVQRARSEAASARWELTPGRGGEGRTRAGLEGNGCRARRGPPPPEEQKPQGVPEVLPAQARWEGEPGPVRSPQGLVISDFIPAKGRHRRVSLFYFIQIYSVLFSLFYWLFIECSHYWLMSYTSLCYF